MKSKNLFIISSLALLALTSCGGGAASSSTAPSSSAASSSAGASSSIVVPTYDVTVKVTPVIGTEGATVLATNAVYIAGSYALFNKGSTASTNWGYSAMTKAADGSWSYTFEDIEAGDYSFNLYIADATASFNWAGGSNESKGNAQQTLTVDDTTDGSTAQTINIEGTWDDQYDPSATFNVDLIVTVVITGGTLSDTNYLWMWESVKSSTVALTKQEDGTWKYSYTDISATEIKVTLVLGSSSAANWDYKCDLGEGYSTSMTADIKTAGSFALTATFASQPA